jgi:hypothetical protein
VAGTGGRAGGGQGGGPSSGGVVIISAHHGIDVCPQVLLLQLLSNQRRRLNFLNRPPLLRKLSRAFLNHLHTEIQGFQAQKLNTYVNTMLLN